MTQNELLQKVKVGLGNIPQHLDEVIKLYMIDVLGYMLKAGVSTTLIDLDNDSISEKCTGAVIRGVSDLWNYGNGDTKLSEYFYQRVDQLRGVYE